MAVRQSAKNKKFGFITLMSVLIVSAVATAVAVSLLLLGLSNSRTALVNQQQTQARSLADGCAEVAMQTIRDDNNFEGSDGYSTELGNCSFEVFNLGGQNREINSTGTVAEVLRKVKITLDQINPEINIIAWQEVADF